MITILFIGDVVGEPGRTAVKHMLPELKKEHGADFVIVNGENAAAGRGITPRLAQELLHAGVDVITTGDHVWDQAELAPWLDSEPRVLRPVNYPQGTPGHGSVVVETPRGKIAVMQVQGRSFIQPPLENPFLISEAEAKRLREEEGVQVIFVDMHAETTSEKISTGYNLDGLVSAVIGTHTHVQTADETILEHGTAYLTDGRHVRPRRRGAGPGTGTHYPTLPHLHAGQIPCGELAVRLCGAVVQVDEATGRALNIARISKIVEKPAS